MTTQCATECNTDNVRRRRKLRTSFGVLTQQKLKDLVHYNQATGVFTWRVAANGRVPAGSLVGTYTHPLGYVRASIKGRSYALHRLAVLYVEGYLPEDTVDHINRDKQDNRYSNLRVVSQQCQNRNSGVAKNNKSGVRGVRLYSDGKWVAKIGVDKRHHHLGYFDTVLEAACARFAAEQCLGFKDCDINSSAMQYMRQNGVCR